MRHIEVILLVLLVVVGVCSGDVLLTNDFYRTKGCPQLEELVRNITWGKVQNDPGLAPGLLRLHYHDCFVRGCDASILLDTVGSNQAEKDAVPNLTLEGFDDIEDIKAQVEQACPGIVSCADILALAARDAVSFPFKKPMWEVLTGRRDGRVSLASEVDGQLPSPFSNFATLIQLFTKKGLTVVDLVVLSGAHTIGDAHCAAFSRRLYNFTGKGDMDRSLDPTYAEILKKQCPNPADPATTVGMDFQSSNSFDNHYYTLLTQKRGLFQSDAALLTNGNSARIVQHLQAAGAFFSEFNKSMKKMGAIGLLTGTAGEIRKKCSVVN